jgi:ketosteroid isomerase-like protein
MRILTVLLTLVLAACAVVSPPGSDTPRRSIEQVFEDFNACRVPELVARYSDSDLVFFTGGTPLPITSHTQLREYFSYLTAQPCSDPRSPKHTNIMLQVRPVASSVAVVHANTVVQYVNEGAAQSRPFFFTFVVQQTAGRWLVISQNAQAVPKE